MTAAKALEERKIDGFWANGMGAEVAVRRGVGTVVLDVRRGDGPKVLQLHDGVDRGDRPADRPRAGNCRRGQARRRQDPAALEGGRRRSPPRSARKLFPPAKAELIAELIRRDLPYYDAAISPSFVAGMNRFARDIGILNGEVPYDRVVATGLSRRWIG